MGTTTAPERKWLAHDNPDVTVFGPAMTMEEIEGDMLQAGKLFISFFWLAIIDLASGGMRPTRRNWIAPNPTSSSSLVSVATDQNLMCP